MRMNYESEINQLPNGLVGVFTRGKGLRSPTDSIALKDYSERTHFVFFSVNELRQSLVREKFHMEILKCGSALTILGFGLMAAAQVHDSLIYEAGQFFIGIISASLGPALQRIGEENLPKVDSRVQAFNETFSDCKPLVKPVVFSPRDYLSTFMQSLPTIRLPFNRR